MITVKFKFNVGDLVRFPTGGKGFVLSLNYVDGCISYIVENHIGSREIYPESVLKKIEEGE